MPPRSGHNEILMWRLKVKVTARSEFMTSNNWENVVFSAIFQLSRFSSAKTSTRTPHFEIVPASHIHCSTSVANMVKLTWVLSRQQRFCVGAEFMVASRQYLRGAHKFGHLGALLALKRAHGPPFWNCPCLLHTFLYICGKYGNTDMGFEQIGWHQLFQGFDRVTNPIHLPNTWLVDPYPVHGTIKKNQAHEPMFFCVAMRPLYIRVCLCKVWWKWHGLWNYHPTSLIVDCFTLKTL